jgi:hypothetical protein
MEEKLREIIAKNRALFAEGKLTTDENGNIVLSNRA